MIDPFDRVKDPSVARSFFTLGASQRVYRSVVWLVN
jgi:hypothetical protein